MLDTSGTGITSDQFARNALRWLSPAGFGAAAWVEQVPDSRRAAYERRIGQPIVTPDERHSAVPAGSRSSYLPATLVSGFDPLAVPGTDLSGEPGMERALARATRLDGVAATPVAPPSTGTGGLFLVAPAPNLVAEVLRPGYVVVFVSDPALRAAATDAPTVQVTAAGTSTEAREHAKTGSRSFTEAGQRFDVLVPREAVGGAAGGGALDRPCRRPRPLRPRGSARGQLGAARPGAGRARPHLHALLRPHRRRRLRRTIHAREPGRRADSGLHGGGAPLAAVPRPGPSGRP